MPVSDIVLTGTPIYTSNVITPGDGVVRSAASVQGFVQPLINNDAYFYNQFNILLNNVNIPSKIYDAADFYAQLPSQEIGYIYNYTNQTASVTQTDTFYNYIEESNTTLANRWIDISGFVHATAQVNDSLNTPATAGIIFVNVAVYMSLLNPVTNTTIYPILVAANNISLPTSPVSPVYQEDVATRVTAGGPGTYQSSLVKRVPVNVRLDYPTGWYQAYIKTEVVVTGLAVNPTTTISRGATQPNFPHLNAKIYKD